MPFTAQDVKTLREMTECGMLDCKKALMETDGDMEKAVELLREKGLAAAGLSDGTPRKSTGPLRPAACHPGALRYHTDPRSMTQWKG